MAALPPMLSRAGPPTFDIAPVLRASFPTARRQGEISYWHTCFLYTETLIIMQLRFIRHGHQALGKGISYETGHFHIILHYKEAHLLVS